MYTFLFPVSISFFLLFHFFFREVGMFLERRKKNRSFFQQETLAKTTLDYSKDSITWKNKIVPLILTIFQPSYHIRIMYCRRTTLRYDLIARNIRKSKIYCCTLKSSSTTQIWQFYVPHMLHAYFSPSNQPIKFSMLKLLNDPVLTSLS